MNLQDIVREQSAPILDLVNGTQKEVDEFLRRQASAEEAERSLKQGAAEMEPAISELERTLRDSQLKLHEIQRQIRELEARLREREKEHERAEEDYNKAKAGRDERLRDAARARKEAEDWGRKVNDARERLERHKRRLLEERRAAFRKHLAALWTRLAEANRKAAAGAEARAALDRLDRARHEDARVADQWEARQEWLRISQSAGPPAVRETARREIQKIEEYLEKEFPGALRAATASAVDELEEVYLCPPVRGERWKLFLFIPEEICETLNDGKTGPDEALAARTVWAFARAFKRGLAEGEGWRSRLEVQDGYLVMQLDPGPGDAKGLGTVAVSLSAANRVTFVLSELPAEIREALNEDTCS